MHAGQGLNRAGIFRPRTLRCAAAMAAVDGELNYIARDGEQGWLNPRTPQRSDRVISRRVTIVDGRGVPHHRHEASLEVRGFTFLRELAFETSHAVLRRPEAVARSGYMREVEQLLLRVLPSVGYCLAFNFVNRRSDLLVHTLPADDRSARGPVNDVHSDFTDDSFVVQGILKKREELGLGGVRVMILNVWRPLCDEGRRLEAWPLAVRLLDFLFVCWFPQCTTRGGGRESSHCICMRACACACVRACVRAWNCSIRSATPARCRMVTSSSERARRTGRASSTLTTIRATAGHTCPGWDPMRQWSSRRTNHSASPGGPTLHCIVHSTREQLEGDGVVAPGAAVVRQ
jgi:hypothetical protein